MDDYSEAGRTKLEQQASTTLDFIRCPLDSAVMLVLRSAAGRYERGETLYREFKGLPHSSEWTVSSVDLECSACRRRADDVRVNAVSEKVLA